MLRQDLDQHKCAVYLLKELAKRKEDLREINKKKEEL
jgi:hypothetical protein